MKDKDDNEFDVFYLPKSGEYDLKIPVGPIKQQPNYPPPPPPPPKESEEDYYKMLLADLKAGGPKEIEIDDVIDSDVISNPVADEIYKLKNLKIIVKYLCTHHSGVGIMFEVDYHGTRFYINKEDNILIKAREYEKDLYLEREL